MNTQQTYSKSSPRHASPAGGTIGDTAIPRGATGEALTCCKPLLDEGEAVAGTDELDVAAGERAPLAGELHGQGGWGARPLRELESGQ